MNGGGMGLQSAIEVIQDICLTVSGVRAAPDYPPEAANVYPFVACYATTGAFRGGPAGVMTALHTIAVEIHVARKELPRDVAAVIPYGELVAAALLTLPTLSGTVDTIRAGEGIAYTFGGMAWGGQETVGWRLLVPVKIQSTL